MRRTLAAVSICLFVCSLAFGQASFARVSGSVTDTTGALIPGVTVTATDTKTGVVSTVLSEDAGTYNFASLLPGTYKITAALTGFQSHTISDLQFGAEQYRLNFTLKIGQAAGTLVDVSAETRDTLLATSSSSVGTVLSAEQVLALPNIGNNVLRLAELVGGVGAPENIGTVFTGESTTFAGVGAANITTVRDGLMVQDVRFGTGISSNTFINPDLVGEIRIILAPVDAEFGRGNGSVQITTRGGTNKYTGALNWTGRNSAFNARTFEQRRANPPGVNSYSNNHQFTLSYGGPILKNKTFFYAVWDQTNVRQRAEVTASVLTPCARNGIFRYWDFYNSVNATAAATPNGTNPTVNSVDVFGNPRAPLVNPNFATVPVGAPAGTVAGGPYTGQLRAVSVFGPVANANSLNADCSNAQVSSTQHWDTYRVQRDPTGYIDRMMKYMPEANYYSSGDGLNTAAIRWLRTNRGLDNLFGVGQDVGARKQINIKIDQNFNARNKANVGWTYEKDDSAGDSLLQWPDALQGNTYRRPSTVTASFTSTLSSRMVNEARFGLRNSGSHPVTSYDYPANADKLAALLPPAVNGIRVLPAMGTGGVNFQNVQPLSPNQGGAFRSTYSLGDRSPVYTYADNLSWSLGAHSFRMGAELRIINSKAEQDGNGTNFSSILALGGNAAGAPITNGTTTSLGNTNPAMAFLGTTDQTRARDLLTFLSGSLNSLTEWFYMMDPKKTDAFEDYRTFPFRVRETKKKEMSAFFKDDWKIRKDLTLNLGVRYDYFGVPYIASGLTIAPTGGGMSLFGITGDFSNWLQARPIFAGAKNYDASKLTAVQFVGPNSQNPDVSAIPHDYNNFSPAIGFAWNVPWFGEGKTTIRGGYQLTYNAGTNASAIEGAISNPPGSDATATYVTSASDPYPYLDLASLTNPGLNNNLVFPLVAPFKPVTAPPIEVHGTGNSYTAYDPHFGSPYTQNFTLTLSRNFSPKVSTEFRYVATQQVHSVRTVNLNESNFLRNPVFQELDLIRQGLDTPANTPVLTQMFTGVNACFATAGCPTTYNDVNGATPITAVYGPIGSTPLQTVGYQMRLNPNFNTNIANGDYEGVMSTLNNYNANLTTQTGIAGEQGRVLRNSGFFPENFFVTNPQFSAANYVTNFGHSNYHSFQVQTTLRPGQGVTGSLTYTFSKGMTLANSFDDPLDRSQHQLTGNRPHEFRSNAVVELPVGPNKFLFGNSSGFFARLIEKWQTSYVLSMSSGAWSTITGASRMYNGTGYVDIVAPIDFNSLKNYEWGNEQNGANLNADYFGGKFTSVPDPQCNTQVTQLQNLNQTTATSGVRRCSLNALAMIVPAGTPGSVVGATGISTLIVAQNSLPGKRGNLGPNTLKGFGSITLDASASKTFRISESKSMQVRIDTSNVMNHPSPGAPTLSIGNTFGNIGSKSGSRTFAGQLRLQF